MKDQSRMWSLMIRKLSGEAEPSEEDELEGLLKANPDNQYAFEMLSEWWDMNQTAPPEKEALSSFRSVRERLHLHQEDSPLPVELLPKEGGTRKKNWWVLAAVICVLVGSAAFFLYFGQGHSFKTNDLMGDRSSISQISTNYGSKSKLVLPDGTMVWLNSGSNLTYDNNKFGVKSRHVQLVGEAYFDVAKDAEYPFIIHAGKINVKVLGTAFDIKSYPGDPTIQTTLIKGAIEISFVNRPKDKIQLEPHQTLTIFNNNMHILNNSLNKAKPKDRDDYTVAPLTIMPKDSTIVQTSWLENKLAFQGEKFTELARQMERWYNVQITFTDSKVKQYKFTGIFMNESLEQALQALRITAPFDYRIDENEVYISTTK